VVELVHAASLIHDDSVDRSTLRRGLPTVEDGLWTDGWRSSWGDYLYAQSMALLVQNGDLVPMDIMAAVVSDMACGEAMEFQHAHDLDLKESDYEELIRAKTGSLIGASSEIGSFVDGGGRTAKRRARFNHFGTRIGVAFQMVDDLFDYLERARGHRQAGRLRPRRGQGHVAAHRRAAAGDADRPREAASSRRSEDVDEGAVGSLVALIERTGGFQYARERAAILAAEARAAIADERKGAARRALDAAIDYAIQRTH
jgi:octaprenyl-diphosphate synthase